MNKKLIVYYLDLLCEKIDLHADGFIDRIEAMRRTDKDRVEFIEKMTLEPLDLQISFLAKKLLNYLDNSKAINGQYKYQPNI